MPNKFHILIATLSALQSGVLRFSIRRFVSSQPRGKPLRNYGVHNCGVPWNSSWNTVEFFVEFRGILRTGGILVYKF